MKNAGVEGLYLVKEFWHQTELCETEDSGEKMEVQQEKVKETKVKRAEIRKTGLSGSISFIIN